MIPDMTARLLIPVLIAIATVCSGATALAEPMSAARFDAYTRGKTLFYGSGGEAYGVEKYLPNRRVLWSFLDGRCQYGDWYPQGDQICFVYESIDIPQCWRFTLGPDGLRAQFEDEPEETQLYETHEINAEMICLGPEVGV